MKIARYYFLQINCSAPGASGFSRVEGGGGHRKGGEEKQAVPQHLFRSLYPLRNARYATLLYGYNSTQALISCFLVINGYYWLGVQGSGQPDGHPFYGQLTVVKKVSTDQCHQTVSQVQVCNSLR